MTLKVDRMERKGHVDAQMSGVREFEHAQSGWAPAQAIMTRPIKCARWICNTGAAGKVLWLACGDDRKI